MKILALANAVRQEPRTVFRPGFDVLDCIFEQTQKVFNHKLETVEDFGDFYNLPPWDTEVLLSMNFSGPQDLADILSKMIPPR